MVIDMIIFILMSFKYKYKNIKDIDNDLTLSNNEEKHN